MTPSHVPVMVAEVLDALPLRPGGVAVDGTLGLGGHAVEMAARLAPGGLIVGLDWDETMRERGEARVRQVEDVDVRTYHADYRELPERLALACHEVGRPVGADAVLLDLGLNNTQIEDPTRGITFREEGPLDMRMDRSRGETAAEWLNRAPAREIEDCLFSLGDERWARKIAQVIVDRRRTRPLATTTDLVDCVLAAIPTAKRDKRLHPATRTFQAVRIEVNRELEELGDAVARIARVLNRGGVLVALSYHSGEDRAVKTAFRDLAKEGGFETLTKKPLVPTEAEVRANPKSRSAKMRALRRVN